MADCIHLYRKYWSALNVAKDYQELPKSDELPVYEPFTMIPSISSVQELAGISSGLSNSVVKLSSTLGTSQISVMGTIIDFTTISGTTTYILSKNSCIADDPKLSINGKVMPVKVIKRDKNNDLVLLNVPFKLTNGIKLGEDYKSLEINTNDLGTLLVSAIGYEVKKVGILSSVYVNMPMIASMGYFGGNATYINQKITITQMSKGSAAEKYLQLNDQITNINGVLLNEPADYGKELEKYAAGDSISIDAIRAGKSLRLKMYLPAYPIVKHVSNEFSGGRSIRSDGFNKVLIQDAAIKAEECGSPVFNATGEFYGINIARHSRSSAVVMPTGEILKLLLSTIPLKNKKY